MQTVGRYFDIIEVPNGTSLGLFKAVSNVLFEKHSIPPKNLIGLDVDNCATMMGKISGFQAQSKKTCPTDFCKRLHLSQFGIVFIPCFQEIACLE